MFDSQEYRNAPTRNIHDVIGDDGTPPAAFRGLAREQISEFYDSATMVNATVESISTVDNGAFFRASAGRKEYTARSVILGTGVVDLLPSTPGIKEGWGKGIFWCPWCDGFEHRDQPMGILGPMSDAYSGVIEIRTLNKDVVIYTNGTDNDEERAALDKKYPGWDKELEAYKVPINNASVKSVERLQSGGKVNDPEEGKQFDKFQLNFADGSSAERNAIILNVKTGQRSNLPSQLGIGIDEDNKIVVGEKYNTTLDGVYGVGDANNDGTTNVPHAMYSGKGAAVKIHGELRTIPVDSHADTELAALAHEESVSAVSKRDLEKDAWESMGGDLEELWERAQRV